ncbi:MAG: C2 domain-containing protein, partial [archaeon]|nr:C2 domain-containing protein [archaeon]
LGMGPKPQSPIPNPQSPINQYMLLINLLYSIHILIYLILIYNNPYTLLKMINLGSSQEIPSDNQNNMMNQLSSTKYAKDIEKMHQGILSSLKQSFPGKTKVTEEELLNVLRQKVPQNKKFNATMFSNLFMDLSRDSENKIDLDEFTRKYIQVHEEFKMYLETCKNEIEKEKTIQTDLEEKKFNLKDDANNRFNISAKSKVTVEIGEVQLFNPQNYSEIYFNVSYLEKSKKTQSKKITKPIFNEQISFPVEDLNTDLTLELYSKEYKDYPLGSSSIPLYVLSANEEVSPGIDIINSGNVIGSFTPRIILITSYNDYYQKELAKTENKIMELEKQIREMADGLESISEPFKSIFEENNPSGSSQGKNPLEDKAIESIDVLMQGFGKKFFKKEKLDWIDVLKFCLLFCIMTSFITSLDRIDFYSLFAEIVFLFMVTAGMGRYLNTYYAYCMAAIGMAIVYDIIDWMTLRSIVFKDMSGVRFWVKVFGFLGFLGKVAWLIFFWVAKSKNVL